MKKDASEHTKTSRRRFTKALTAAAVAGPLSAVAARAQTPTATPSEPKAPPNPQPAQQSTQQQPNPVADAYAEVAKARFGSQLNDEEMRRVRRDIAGNVRAAETLRAYKLQNWDEPDTIFTA